MQRPGGRSKFGVFPEQGAGAGGGALPEEMLEKLSRGRVMAGLKGGGQELKCYSDHNREPLMDFNQGSNIV